MSPLLMRGIVVPPCAGFKWLRPGGGGGQADGRQRRAESG